MTVPWSLREAGILHTLDSVVTMLLRAKLASNISFLLGALQWVRTISRGWPAVVLARGVSRALMENLFI